MIYIISTDGWKESIILEFCVDNIDDLPLLIDAGVNEYWGDCQYAWSIKKETEIELTIELSVVTDYSNLNTLWYIRKTPTIHEYRELKGKGT